MADPPAALDHLRLRSFHLLKVLTDCGSLRGAAERMHTTQPALSAMLRDLENTLGGRLFERSRRGLTPTELGKFAARHADILLADVGRLRDEIVAQSQGRSLLRVGVLPLLMLEMVPAALSHLRRTAPWLRIEFHEGSVSSLIGLLRDGAIDLVVGRMTSEHASDRELERLHLFSERLSVVAAANHPLAALPRIAWPKLSQAVWVLPPPDTILRQTFIEAFLRRGLQPPGPTYESASFASSINIVAQTDCLMVAPRTVAAHYLRYGNITMLKADLGEPEARIDVIRRRQRPGTKSVDLFVAAVQAAVATANTSAGRQHSRTGDIRSRSRPA